jgi:hypothetical protein
MATGTFVSRSLPGNQTVEEILNRTDTESWLLQMQIPQTTFVVGVGIQILLMIWYVSSKIWTTPDITYGVAD